MATPVYELKASGVLVGEFADFAAVKAAMKNAVAVGMVELQWRKVTVTYETFFGSGGEGTFDTLAAAVAKAKECLDDVNEAFGYCTVTIKRVATEADASNNPPVMPE